MVQLLVAIRIQVTERVDVISTLDFTATGVRETTNVSGVVDDLNGHAVGLKLQEVVHHLAGHITRKIIHAVLVELCQPDLLQHVLNFLGLVVLHEVRDEAGVLADISEVINIADTGVKEFAEIVTDGEINKNLLVESSIIITLYSLDVLKFGEVTKGIQALKKEVKWLLVLETLNHTHNILDLIAVEHTLEETGEWLDALTDHVLNFSHELFFAALFENNDFNWIRLVHNVAAVVSVLENELELL